MSKIASSCENCIFAKKFPEVPHPGEAPEFKPLTFWERFWNGTGDRWVKEMEWENAVIRWHRYKYNRTCTRFPKTERKHIDDFCGEHQAS